MAAAPEYDVIIVGAGIAGCSLAHALSTIKSTQPLKVALFERSLAEPDRIVGELLQPGGVHSLENLGIRWTLDGIDAIPEYGYCVVNVGGSRVQIPYPKGEEGRSFHHGRFIMRLREAATKASGVKVFERTVNGFVMSESGKKVVGVRATHKTTPDEVEEYRAKLVVVADGCFSNFRSTVMGVNFPKPVTKSHFVGLVLENAKLPMPNHGTVALCKKSGPVLMYQIGENDTRMLVDVKNPVPANLAVGVPRPSDCNLHANHLSIGTCTERNRPISPRRIAGLRSFTFDEGPTTTDAQLIPSARSSISLDHCIRKCVPTRRCMEYAPPSHWRRNDGSIS